METLLPEGAKNRETLADVKKRARLEVAPEAASEPEADAGEVDAEGDVAM